MNNPDKYSSCSFFCQATGSNGVHTSSKNAENSPDRVKIKMSFQRTVSFFNFGKNPIYLYYTMKTQKFFKVLSSWLDMVIYVFFPVFYQL